MYGHLHKWFDHLGMYVSRELKLFPVTLTSWLATLYLFFALSKLTISKKKMAIDSNIRYLESM